MIDDLFNLIINKSEKIPKEFYELIKRLGFNYTKEIIENYQIDKIKLIKEIIYTLYEIYKDNLQNVLLKMKREDLIGIYNLCKTFETDDFIAYYKKAIINKYSNNKEYKE